MVTMASFDRDGGQPLHYGLRAMGVLTLKVLELCLSFPMVTWPKNQWKTIKYDSDPQKYHYYHAVSKIWPSSQSSEVMCIVRGVTPVMAKTTDWPSYIAGAERDGDWLRVSNKIFWGLWRENLPTSHCSQGNSNIKATRMGYACIAHVLALGDQLVQTQNG